MVSMSERELIPFMREFHEHITVRRKTMTCRTRPYGKPGDILQVAGTRILIKLISVTQVELGDVARSYYRQEGCESPMEFRETWAHLHPGRGYSDHQKVWLHEFRYAGLGSL